MNDARPQQELGYEFDIKITGNDTSTPKRFSWVQVYRDKNGVWNELKLKGDFNYDPAYEYNSANVTAGTVCKARRDGRTGQLLFFSRTKSGETGVMVDGLYTAFFFQLPSLYYFNFITHHGVNPGFSGVNTMSPPRYTLFNKAIYSDKMCATFSNHKTQIFANDGTLFYEKSYTAENPLLGIVKVTIPDKNYYAVYTVYKDDGTILQEFSGVAFKLTGELYSTAAQDIRYVSCPFTNFSAGTYGQVKYVCNSLVSQTNVLSSTSNSWPAPNFTYLKLSPRTVNISGSVSIPPEQIPPPSSSYDYAKASALRNGINGALGISISRRSPNEREYFSYYPAQGSTFKSAEFSVGADKFNVYAFGQVSQSFRQVPVAPDYPCDTSTTSGFVTGTAYAQLGSGASRDTIGQALNTDLNYSATPSPINTFPTTPNIIFEKYGVPFTLQSFSVTFS